MALEDCSIGLVQFFSWLPCIAPTLRRFSLSWRQVSGMGCSLHQVSSHVKCWVMMLAPSLERPTITMVYKSSHTSTLRCCFAVGSQTCFQSKSGSGVFACCELILLIYADRVYDRSFYRGCWVIIIVPYCKRYTGTGSGSCPEAVMLFWPSSEWTLTWYLFLGSLFILTSQNLQQVHPSMLHRNILTWMMDLKSSRLSWRIFAVWNVSAFIIVTWSSFSMYRGERRSYSFKIHGDASVHSFHSVKLFIHQGITLFRFHFHSSLILRRFLLFSASYTYNIHQDPILTVYSLPLLLVRRPGQFCQPG